MVNAGILLDYIVHTNNTELVTFGVALCIINASLISLLALIRKFTPRQISAYAN